MDEVEKAMARQRSHNNPKRRTETQGGNGQEADANERFEEKRLCGRPQDGEQGVLRRDHDRHRRVEGPVTIEADDCGTQTDREGETESDQQRHDLALKTPRSSRIWRS